MMNRIIKISARGMARIRVGGKLLTEISGKTGRPQAIGGHIQAYAPGIEYLRGLGFAFHDDPVSGAVDIRGKIPQSRLPEFEAWFIRTRILNQPRQRELGIGREMVEELDQESNFLPGLAQTDLRTGYLWTTKPSFEGGRTQRYLEVHDVTFQTPSFYDRIVAALGRQQKYLLVDEAALPGSDSKLLSLAVGKVPYLAGALLTENYR